MNAEEVNDVQIPEFSGKFLAQSRKTETTW
jgi:hypothetical protein